MLAIINYGMGNLRSVLNALHYLGVEPMIVNNPGELSKSDKIILPGVGSYNRAMKNICSMGFDKALNEAVINREVPLLGICVGMQILGKSGTEDGHSKGLGFIDCSVDRFAFNAVDNPGLKVPHVGFNSVTIEYGSELFSGLGKTADFYFTHSYRMDCEDKEVIAGSCYHGERFAAVVQKGHICGTQFHPEKSQSNGIALLRNFLEKF